MRNRAIYFFLLPEGVSRDNYAHNALVLAEGLEELGWEIYANIDYWKEAPEAPFLFRHDPDVRPEDCAINVLTYDWMHFINVIPYELQENKNSIRVYLEDAGWLKTPGLDDRFRIFDLVLKSHFNNRCKLPDNYRPWSFGISRRVLKATQNVLPFPERRRSILVNFGATHSYRHELRELFEERVYPQLSVILEVDRRTNGRNDPPADPYHRFMWEQTAGRHYPDYYERLCTSQACSCVGGQLIPNLPDDWSVLHGSGGRRLKLRRLAYSLLSRSTKKAPRWNQWESWRWWESMAAGCACFMLDFEKYGVQLPVQPQNWKHYVGLDLDDVAAGISRILDQPTLLPRLAMAGREWAVANYDPPSIARLFLQLVNHQQETTEATPEIHATGLC